MLRIRVPVRAHIAITLVHGRHHADVRRRHQASTDDSVDPPRLVHGPSHGAGYER